MLRQVEAIGKTGRNWPIRLGKDQTKLIAQSVKSSGQSQAISAESSAPSSVAQPETSSGKSQQDFHTRLFATGGDEEPRSRSREPSVAPRELAKPQPREWNELFAGDESATAANISSPGVRSPHQPVLKAGAGKNFDPNRLFDETEPSQREKSSESRKADPTKFQHFEFGNGEDAPVAHADIPGRKIGNQNSKWDFEDFVTPEKNAQRPNPEQDRHFGYGIDEDDPKSPPKRIPIHLPRPDAKPHFEMTDENTPATDRHKPLSTTTNVNSNRRHDEDARHFNISKEESPAANENIDPDHSAGGKPGKRSDMTSSWNFSDMQQGAPVKEAKIYKTYGDGKYSSINREGFKLTDARYRHGRPCRQPSLGHC